MGRFFPETSSNEGNTMKNLRVWLSASMAVIFSWAVLATVLAQPAAAAEAEAKQPAAKAAVAAKEFAFTLTGDPREGVSRWVHTLRQIKEKIGKRNAFHITAGDYEGIEPFDKAFKAVLGKDALWYPGVGNHEMPRKGSKDMKWLRNYYHTKLKGKVNPGPKGGEETTYSWDYGNAHFAQLNMYLVGTKDTAESDGDIEDSLFAWLKADLAKNTKPVIFVIYHEPQYPKGRGGKDYDGKHRGRFWKLLDKYKVVGALCAHSHTYGRGQHAGNRYTWEVDAGNAGRRSHGDKHQTFVEITVGTDGKVQFNTWQGNKGREFSVKDKWTAQVDVASAKK